jgi:mercuric reductase
MKREQFDLVVLGSGSAARDGANKAATEHGAKVAIVERKRWGGSCPNVACKPTKAYLVSAELTHDVNSLADLLGVEVGPARADLARVKAHKDSLLKPQPQWVADLEQAGFTPIEGTGTLVDSHTVRVGDRELEAERILVATGPRTAAPPIAGLDEVGWVDHISALELTELPESLLVLGAGPVGLEFGQGFARFGSRVTIVDGFERISPRSDAAAAAELHAALEDEGLELVTNTFVSKVERDGAEIVATLAPRDGSPQRDVRVAQILLASGRVPNLEELELERAGVEHSTAGITVDDRMRTTAAGIWAAGDVTAVFQLTPIAQYQARIAVDDMFSTNGAVRADYAALPSAIFTDPEVGAVGLTEDEAAEQELDFETVSHPITSVTRSTYTDTKRGVYKIVFDRGSRRVLGLHVVARNAGDIVQGFAVAMRLGATVDDLARSHHAFPTLAEGVKAAAEKAGAPVAA